MKRRLLMLLMVCAGLAPMDAHAPAVIGGVDALPRQVDRQRQVDRPRDVPWTVELVLADNTVQWNGAHVCGGALIAPRWVLTAAHCVVDAYPRRLPRWVIAGSVKQGAGVRAGVVDPVAWKGKIDWDNHQVFICSETSTVGCDPYVPSIARAGDRKGAFSRNDIALIHLAAAPPLGDKGDIATIPPDSDPSDHPGAGAQVSGWGVTSEAASETPYAPANGHLKIAPLQLQDAATCRRQTLKRYENDMDASTWPDSVICAGPPGVDLDRTPTGSSAAWNDVCKGDSGGALTRRRADGREVVTGVASWELVCGGGAGLYTRVARFKPWIDQVIAANGGPG